MFLKTIMEINFDKLQSLLNNQKTKKQNEPFSKKLLMSNILLSEISKKKRKNQT